MLFSVRLVSRQPHDMSPEAWQSVQSEQLKAVKAHWDQGRVKAIYRETGVGVLAIYDLADAREMDTMLSQMPMSRFFTEVTVRPAWDLSDVLRSL